jgi:hypothetical protein
MAMRRIRTYLLVTLGFGLAGAIGASFATGTAQAIVAALVQVANTTTSPVPISNVNDPGRIPYQTQLFNDSCGAVGNCVLTFPTVPTGHRVVVQHITATDGFNGQPTYFLASVAVGDTTVSNFLPSFFSKGYLFDQPVLFYADSGQAVKVEFSTDNKFSGLGTITLTGYELDCTVAACAQIATQ